MLVALTVYRVFARTRQCYGCSSESVTPRIYVRRERHIYSDLWATVKSFHLNPLNLPLPLAPPKSHPHVAVLFVSSAFSYELTPPPRPNPCTINTVVCLDRITHKHTHTHALFHDSLALSCLFTICTIFL
ncbi:unnamed protein product [Calicophoron daubneyi]|uniref:Secreted protein n=1 Tax=Calicophoron daubneyi TaxID=300641 RepID=A0AAV2THZ2_CALDB